MVEDEQQEVELPLDSAGMQLARAREAAGMSRAQLADKTKISERQLAAIEAGNYGALSSRAYAVGFSRTYARAVGLDDNAIVALVRDELAATQQEPVHRTAPAFEPGDPARLPGGKVAWFAAAGLAVVLLAGYLFWPNLFAPGGTLPSLLPADKPSPVASAPATPAPAQSNGPVVFTATRDKVWVQFLDGTGTQLFQKELALGESWTLPQDAAGVTLNTARPDGLAITIGGQAQPPLATTEQVIRGVPVTAEALLARAAGPAPAATTAASTPPRTEPAPRRQPRPAPVRAADQPVAEPAAAEATPAAAPAPAPAGATPATADR